MYTSRLTTKLSSGGDRVSYESGKVYLRPPGLNSNCSNAVNISRGLAEKTRSVLTTVLGLFDCDIDNSFWESEFAPDCGRTIDYMLSR